MRWGGVAGRKITRGPHTSELKRTVVSWIASDRSRSTSGPAGMEMPSAMEEDLGGGRPRAGLVGACAWGQGMSPMRCGGGRVGGREGAPRTRKRARQGRRGTRVDNGRGTCVWQRGQGPALGAAVTPKPRAAFKTGRTISFFSTVQQHARVMCSATVSAASHSPARCAGFGCCKKVPRRLPLEVKIVEIGGGEQTEVCAINDALLCTHSATSHYLARCVSTRALYCVIDVDVGITDSPAHV